MNGNQAINRLLLLATAPFVGMVLWMLTAQSAWLMPALPEWSRPVLPLYSAPEEAVTVGQRLEHAAADGALIKTTVEQYYDIYTKSANEVSVMLKNAVNQTKLPAAIFDKRISAVFGPPIRQADSDNLNMKLYAFTDRNYKGYALKAELRTANAMKLALGGDKLGRSETTLAAANRLGAVAGINAGGFADDGGKRYPTGNTMQNGKFVYGFFPSDDLAFVGLNADRKLIGGKFRRQEDLEQLQPQFGASFTPILLKDGKKQTIPVKWMTSPYRAARTVVGSFKNDQLLFIVTDGLDERGGSGASLAELQDKLQQLGIRDAYNLDGGGSSTLVWGGELINKPSDGRMRSMPTHFLFFE